MTEVIRGEGALRDTVSSLSGEECVILGGQTSFEASGAALILESLHQSGARIHRVRGPLPTTVEVDRLVGDIGDDHPSVLMGVGGGLVLDTMKAVGLSMATGQTAAEMITGGVSQSGQPSRTIAVPTTAGSGAERTPFAVLYLDGVKHSVDDSRLLPSLAVIDPELGRSAPRPVAAAAALDALAHCVESLWACRSTKESRVVALDALARLNANIESAVNNDLGRARDQMMYAASDAGASIAITRTTAAHALSYHLTSEYGIAHGHAVALTLGHVAAHNEGVDEESVADDRGVDHVRAAVSAVLGAFALSSGAQLTAHLRGLMDSLGLASTVDAAAKRRVDRQVWASSVNVERLANNPRRLDRDGLLRLVQAA